MLILIKVLSVNFDDKEAINERRAAILRKVKDNMVSIETVRAASLYHDPADHS